MFTNIDANTLVSWFVTVVVFLYGSSKLYMNRAFRAWYMSLRNKPGIIPTLPTPRLFGLIWFVISGCFIASMTLWTMNYSTCYNTYFIVIIVMALSQLVFLAAWGPVFIKWKRPALAFVCILLALLCGVTALVLMSITVAQFTTDGSGTVCITDKAAGIAAIVLWAVPHLWYIFVLYFTWTVWYMKDKYNWANWEKFIKRNRPEKTYTYDNNYGGSEEQPNDMETGLLPKKNRVNLKNSH